MPGSIGAGSRRCASSRAHAMVLLILRPDLSARSGLGLGLGLLMGGYSLLGTFVVFAALRPAALTAGLTVILAVRRYDVGAFIP